MRGERVIAKALGGVPVVLTVWETGRGVVYLANDAEFEKRQAGREALEPIGFPVSDVFIYDKAFLSARGKWDWGKLKRWRQMKLATH